MTTVRIDLSIEQIKTAIQQLPSQEKLALWRLLDAEVDRPKIAKRFADALRNIRSAHAHLTEDQVMLDIAKATRQVRTKHRHAQNRP